MATVKSKDDSRAKDKAILGCLGDYSGFKLIENGSVMSVFRTTVVGLVIKSSHITDLTLR